MKETHKAGFMHERGTQLQKMVTLLASDDLNCVNKLGEIISQ